jgi:AmmeMemoRadiSam system protein B
MKTVTFCRGKPYAGVAIIVAVSIALCIPTGCSKPPHPSHLTWSARRASYPHVDVPSPEDAPRDGDMPIAGTVSHHLLAGSRIDDWFRALASKRNVETFIIVSPRHHGIGSESVSVGTGAWRTADGEVETDEKIAERIRRALGVAQDPTVFEYEHGISTLVPFIRDRFPRARIVAIAISGEPPVNTTAARILTDALLPILTGSDSAKYFLVISADFSHHGDRAETSERDAISRRFFERPAMETWIFALCDNRPGMFVLASLADAYGNATMRVLHHTDSFAISGRGERDITSYFFTLLCTTR